MEDLNTSSDMGEGAEINPASETAVDETTGQSTLTDETNASDNLSDESEGTENTGEGSDEGEGSQAPKEKPVPYDRFKDVVDERNEYRGENTQLRDENRQLRELLNRQGNGQASGQGYEGADTTQDPEVKAALDTLRKAGIKPADEVLAEIRQEQRAERFRSTVSELAKKYNGKDGRPAFDPTAVAKHMDENGGFGGDPERAYNDLHRSALIDWEVQQRTKRKAGTFSEGKGSAAMSPMSGGVSAKAIAEAKQNRDFTSILKKL